VRLLKYLAKVPPNAGPGQVVVARRRPIGHDDSVPSTEVTSPGPDDVLVIRRSTRKTALWAAGIGTAALLCGLGLLQRATSAKVTGGVFLLLLGVLAPAFGYRLLKPRDLLRVGPEGIDQLAYRPRAFIPWEEITDILRGPARAPRTSGSRCATPRGS
jgi:hypothetical protein